VKNEVSSRFGIELGDRIRAARRRKLLGQNRLAKKIGVVPNIISSYELGKIIPSLPTLMKLSEALSVSVAYFAGEHSPLADEIDFAKVEDAGRPMYPAFWSSKEQA